MVRGRSFQQALPTRLGIKLCVAEPKACCLPASHPRHVALLGLKVAVKRVSFPFLGAVER